MKKRRVFNWITTAMAAAGTLFLLIAMVTPYVVQVTGDTSSLQGGQAFSGGFGYFAVCDNVRSADHASSCGLITTDLMFAVERFRSVTNYIDRTKCLDRQMDKAAPYLRTAQAFVIIGLAAALMGTSIAAYMTFFRPRDVAVYSVQPRWKRRVGWNPLFSCLLLLCSSFCVMISVAVYAFLFETWIGCLQSFCDVCRYAVDCTCDYGASMVFSVLAVFSLFVSGLLMGIRWFRIIGGSSVECPCSD